MPCLKVSGDKLVIWFPSRCLKEKRTLFFCQCYDDPKIIALTSIRKKLYWKCLSQCAWDCWNVNLCKYRQLSYYIMTHPSKLSSLAFERSLDWDGRLRGLFCESDSSSTICFRLQFETEISYVYCINTYSVRKLGKFKKSLGISSNLFSAKFLPMKR